MDTESHDPLRAFCEGHISRHREKWPTTEYELAQAFVLHFGIPLVFRVEDLQNFLVRTNIELIEHDFPADLLGINMSFGDKRQIYTSTNADHVPFQVHTVLHEIREFIEADFRRLGLATTNSSGLESRADEFAFAVHIGAAAPLIQDWVKGSAETNSTWRSLASLFVSIVFFALFGLSSLFGAFGYRFQGSSVKRPRLKRT
jgi:hypothetical protein